MGVWWMFINWGLKNMPTSLGVKCMYKVGLDKFLDCNWL